MKYENVLGTPSYNSQMRREEQPQLRPDKHDNGKHAATTISKVEKMLEKA